MRKIFFLLFFIFTPLLSFAQIGVFTRNLYLGMHGEDVRALQKFLNTDPETLVAGTGAGSLGNETDYFGLATKRALVKFQNKYYKEILSPVGLTVGTGFFGVKTQEEIIKLMEVANPTTTSIEPQSNSIEKAKLESVTITTSTIASSGAQIVPVKKGKVVVMFPSQYSGKPGTPIAISGSGFTSSDNTVFFGDSHSVSGVSSWNGQSITVNVPSVPKGLYSLYVSNANGYSNKEEWFIVTDGVSPGPSIGNIVPSSPSKGDIVTINGSGFLPEGNTVVASGIGIFKNISSNNGTSLSFVIPQGAFPITFAPSVKNPSLPITVHVLNENGVSKMARFTLKF